ncbi:ATP-binding cassette-type vacuolar membrane transporter Hmt1, partial [Cryomyces antarcticus]
MAAVQSPSSEPWVSNKTAQGILLYLHYAYPIILLFFFLFAFTTHSVVTASNANTIGISTTQTGPGGKPLPKGNASKATKDKPLPDFSRPRKLLFDWLSLAAALTFIANSITVIVHALVKREESWWCGGSVV